MTRKSNTGWVVSTILLSAIIIAGSIIIGVDSWQKRPIEMSLAPETEICGNIYISGSVAAPGYYPLLAGDSLESLIRAAGGATADADFNHLKLYLPGTTELDKPQRIDLNRAEAWLLKSLPGIGDTLAKRIVDYRESNGSFRNTGELTLVEGIGPTTYENI